MNKYFKQIKVTALLGVILSMGLTSCQFTNKYKAPVLDTEGLYRVSSSTDTTTIASIPWKQYFKDSYLQTLIVEGLENNFDMKIAVERIKQAEAQVTMGKLAYFPDFAIAGSGQLGRLSVNPSTGVKDVLAYRNNEYSLGLAATWEIDVWGKINRQYRSVDAQYLASVESKYVIQTSLIANIATMYYSLLSLDEQLVITKEMIVLLEKSTETMQAMMNAGLLNAAAVEQSKALLYSTEVSVPTLEYNIQQLENSICSLLGRKPGNLNRGKLAAQAVPTQLAFGVPAHMLANRPDVKAAEFNFKSAFELTNVAQASFYPSISLRSGFLGYGSNTVTDFFKPENLLLTLVGNLTQPLFSKGKLKGNLKIAKANQEIALYSFEKAVLDAGIEVSNILNQFEKSLSKNVTRQKQVTALVHSVDYTQKLLKGGEVTSYLEVINAQQSLLSAQLSQVSDKFEQLQCTVDLYRALGGGVN